MSLRIRYNSPVVLTFALIATAIFFINDAMGRPLDNYFVLAPDFNFNRPAAYLSLVLYTLGHANIEHLLGNMSLFLLVGPILEEKYGSRNLLIMIIFTAFISAVLHILFFEHGLLGASGIVFMFIILVSFTNTEQGGIPLTFILILALFLGKEIINSFQEDNVSQFAHIAGGITGSIFGFMVKKKKPIVHQQY